MQSWEKMKSGPDLMAIFYFSAPDCHATAVSGSHPLGLIPGNVAWACIVCAWRVSRVFPGLMFSPGEYASWAFPCEGAAVECSHIKSIPMKFKREGKTGWRPAGLSFPSEAKFPSLFTCRDADPRTAPSTVAHDECKWYKCVENLPHRTCLVPRLVSAEESHTLIQPFVQHRHELGTCTVCGVGRRVQP